MKLPPDWDKPGEGNDALCRLFSREEYDGGVTKLPYRLFVPKTGNGKLPLVLYMHGADAVGRDNELPLSMHDIGTMFAKETWQKEHPCFIAAPQYGPSQYWSNELLRNGVQAMVHELIFTYPSIDINRLYLYGYSAGGVGVMRMLKEYPGIYAGAVSICGATGQEDLEKLLNTPLWLVHAADDTIVRASYKDSGFASVHLGSRDIMDRLRDRGGELKYTEYPAGYMQEKYGVNPHCSWVAVSDPKNRVFAEWLFEKSR